ncbi:di-heme oxidoredictase family protein [Alteromonadaceae bacterium BrNp21-10]|nr:di-heme oxidoredictase family protein [Alteromonadaceae bacterium BrNp21-10]
MKLPSYIKGIICTLALFASVVQAEWSPVTEGISLTESSARYLRSANAYIVQVTVTNNTSTTLTGPFRLLLDDASLAVLESSGSDINGVPYIEFQKQELIAGASMMVTAKFAFDRRTRLTFTSTLQNNASDWVMVWSDEFDGQSIDFAKWEHELNCDGGGNQEKQCYTDSPDNSFVENGILNIVAKPQANQALPYSSARLRTKYKGDWTYGRFEIRAKAPSGQGAWPAIWMLPTDEVYGGWPHSGEIDIFEAVNLGAPLAAGSDAVQKDVYGTLHYGKSWPNNDNTGHNYALPNGENPTDAFHVYVMEWEEGEMRWYVDGVLFATQRQSDVTYNEQGNPDGLLHQGWYTEKDGELDWSSAPFDEKFHLILNFAVGGSWPENVNVGGVDASAFHEQNKFEIDYVRVYECAISPSNGQGCATVTDGYDESIDNGGTLVNGLAPLPVPPSDGIARELTIFDDAINDSWPAWDCCGNSTPAVVVDDGDHGNVVEFSIGSTAAVVGFNTNESGNRQPYDGLPMLGKGVLEFDLKLVTPPNNASAKWNLKVEQAGATTEVVVTIDTPTSEWQHYSIPLRNLAGAGLNLNGIDVVMIFPDWGDGEGAVFRVDNLAFKEGQPAPPGEGLNKRILMDFEQPAVNYNFANFDGGVSAVIANPQSEGINTSAQVVQMQKYAGANWGGSTFTLNEAIDVDNTLFSMKVWSDRAVNVLFKLEGMEVERSVAHSGSGWEELTFDFNGDAGTGVTQITVIFDLGILGDAAADPNNWTFYYDDVGIFEAPNLDVINFEQAPASYSFLNFEGGVSTVIANPQSEGINTSAQVVQMQKYAGAPWGGTVVTLDKTLDIDSTVFTMKVWSDRVVNVLFKLEGMNVQRSIAHSGNGWEELSFDFNGEVGSGVTQVTVIFDIGILGDADANPNNWTFYYDDISFPSAEDDPIVVTPEPTDFLVDFEAAAESYTFANFDGGVSYVIANPQVGANNGSAQVSLMQKFAGAQWGGSTLTLAAPFAVNSTVFTMKVWSARAVNVLFKLEGMNIERIIAHAGTGWEELSFDFAGTIGNITQITFIFDLGVLGDADNNPANWTFYFDDIKLAGGSEPELDSDADGVLDSNDLCPATPAKSNVDATGCVIVINLDSDGDGVFDSNDVCPNTPANSDVDDTGCVLVVSIDSDGDGITDANDQCADTPANTVVDGLGCPLVLDSVTGVVQDSETSVYFYVNTLNWADVHFSINGGGQQNVRMQIVGGMNIFNVANLTSGDQVQYWFTYLQDSGGATDSPQAYFVVGGGSITDSDNDGVLDNVDQCPNTPAGAEVDTLGCSIVGDSDNDGVLDDIDLCPNTAAGSEVDVIGCALIPIEDADNDGVADENDQCPATPANDLVDSLGCTIIQTVSEVAAMNDILVGGSGSTKPAFALYVFDNDQSIDGSVCNDDCAVNWPPVLVNDGAASGVADLTTIERDDGTFQAAHNGRPLYFYINDLAAGDTNGDGAGGVWHIVEYSIDIGDVTPLFSASTELEQAISFDRGDALVTRFADRGRDRHAKEDQFQIYDHYLSHYWTHRTAQFEFVDYVAKGGASIEINFITEWKLGAREFRAWYRGLNTVAEYHGNYFGGGAVVEVDSGSYDFNFNKISDDGDQYRYQVIIDDYRPLNWGPSGGNLPLEVGQRMEVEVSQFLDAPPEGRENYYGTTYLYIVGQGLVPWKTVGDFDDKSSEREDSYPIDQAGWLGGETTLPYNYTNEPDNHFMQMATNLSNVNGQVFVEGRRVHHSSFVTGQHDERNGENGVFADVVGKAGTHYINESCAGCHERNGRAAPAPLGEPLDKWVFKVGDATGAPDSLIGRVLQPSNVGINNLTDGEGSVAIASWAEENGLRSPNYEFSQGTPAQFSARIAPQLVGLGLLEAIPESTILDMEDVDDSNADGISGKANRVIDPITGETRLGRFGWKASTSSIKHQVAAAFNTDMGVMSSMLPDPDCGSAQSLCGESGAEVSDKHLDELSKYISLLGVRAQRDLDDVQVQQGQALFANIGCTGCHTDTLQTSEFHPLAELRNQTIHPYTDLLLHDMGEGLADNLADGQASGAEWRTTPLWGIGLSACVTGGVVNPIGGQGNEVCTPEHSYLHDGRARTIDEAILWHGGESQASRVAYESLNESDKSAVLAFLNSL